MKETLKAAKFDFCLVKPYLKGFRFSILMVLFLVVFNKSLVFGVFLTTIISTMLISYPFSISEKNGMEKMYGILPISKKHLVIGRYVFTFSVGLLVSLLSPAVCSILLRVLGVTVTLPEICTTVVLGLAVFSFYTVIQIPGFYKYGVLEGKKFVYIPILIYAVLMFVLLKFDVAAGWFISFILENPLVIGVTALLICVIAYWVSITVSVRVLQNKEM